jgi:hypothetical protein
MMGLKTMKNDFLMIMVLNKYEMMTTSKCMYCSYRAIGLAVAFLEAKIGCLKSRMCMSDRTRSTSGFVIKIRVR